MPDASSSQDPSKLEAARGLIEQATQIAVLTGAGISTDSGIPDFRGPNGLWTKNPEAEKASNIRYYEADTELRAKNWALRAEGALWANVEPNLGHQTLVKLEEQGKLHTLITQNVDELHQRAGTSEDKVVEIHGTTRKVGCLSCEYAADMEVALDRVRAGEPDPSCPECDGVLKSKTISFGQNLVEEDLYRAEVAATECDLMFAIGTSLAVSPINRVVPIAAQRGAKVLILNGEPTEMDRLADVVINDSISDVLPQIIL